MKEYNLTIKKKAVKNISIRVKSFDEVVLTVPYFVSKKKALEFLESKKSWIEKTLLKMQKPSELKEGAEFKYLGEVYTISFHDDLRKKVFYHDKSFYIYHVEPQKHLDNFLKQKAKEIFIPLVEAWAENMDKKVHRVSIKTMKTRWGSCNTQKHYINLNQNLIHHDIKVIEYVIVHELAHLTHANHSREFHLYVEKFLPDWKERKKQLI